ncbi:MAG: hypothetical protein ACYDAY_07865 [Candidatus Dormibacteria bacterium]
MRIHRPALLALGCLLAAACSTGASTGSAPESPGPPVAANLGFDPEVNSFSFQNYTNTDPVTVTNLTPDDVAAIFGDQVCAGRANGCELTPPANDWMDAVNQSMSGGHCQGMSVTALAMYTGRLKPSDYGGATIADLTLQDNQKLQRRIAQSFAFQYFDSVSSATVKGTPSEILSTLDAALKDKHVTYGLGIYKADRSGGHEITPYGVVDKGNGQFAIQVYDNNFPKEAREVMVDPTANTWTYSAAASPDIPESLYQGNADTRTLELDPLEPGFAQQPCPFCGKDSTPAGSDSKGSVASSGTIDVFLEANPDSHAHLLLTDSRGKRIGYSAGRFVNEISGARADYPRTDAAYLETEEPDYHVPAGAYTLTLDGSGMAAPDDEFVDVVGPSWDVNVDGIAIAPGQRDSLAISAAGDQVTYTAGGIESPVLELGASDANADYTLDATANGLVAGSLATLKLGAAFDFMSSTDASFDLSVLREDDQGEATFKHSGVPGPAGANSSIAYSAWTAKGQPMTLTQGGQQSDLTDQG